MFRKMKKVLALCLTGAVLLCGCSESGSKQSNIDETKENWNNEELESGVVADLKLDYEENKKYSYQVTYKNLSAEKVKDVLFPNDTSRKNYDKEPDDGGSDYETLTTEDGLEIISHSEGIMAETQEYHYLDNAVTADRSRLLEQNEEYSEDVDNVYKYIGSDEELPNLKRDDVEELCKRQIKELGIPLEIGQIDIRTFSPQNMNDLMKEAEKAMEEEKEESGDIQLYDENYIKEWKENDGIYYLHVTFTLDGTVLNYSYRDDRIDSTEAPDAETYYAEFWYNEDGCVGASFEYFEITDKKEEETITGAYAVEAVKNDITSVILSDNGSYELTGATLCYTVVSGESKDYSEQVIRPVWIVSVNYQEGGQENFHCVYTYFVNAITGEVMKTC